MRVRYLWRLSRSDPKESWGRALMRAGAATAKDLSSEMLHHEHAGANDGDYSSSSLSNQGEFRFLPTQRRGKVRWPEKSDTSLIC